MGAGLIGRNGKGKTTFANLLLGKYEYRGSISAPGIIFDYFPYTADGEALEMIGSELAEGWKCGVEEWKIICELNKLNTDPEILYTFKTLSHGERSKVMLAVLFSGENDFLIIDEPTNHMDMEARKTVKQYLAGKKGFILISHDRDLLDAVTDHCLVLNRKTIEVCAGNFSVWWEHKQRKDAYSEHENEKHLKETSDLRKAADRAGRWAEKSEAAKIGFDPIKEHDRSLSTRAHLYTWDEPLNYIDVFSRMQIEDLILKYKPTMRVVDHDVRFRERVGTRVYEF